MIVYGRWFLLSFIFLFCVAEQITYLSVEHPVITYYNPKYVSNVSITSRRFGRHNPIHYLNVHVTALVYAGNNVTISFYLYEFLSNTYKRGFIEVHYRLCNFIDDKLFGVLIRSRFNDTIHCPFRPGYYGLMNMTMPPTKIPKNVPFKKGRLYTNVTITSTKEPVAAGYADMELKEMRADKFKLKDLFL